MGLKRDRRIFERVNDFLNPENDNVFDETFRNRNYLTIFSFDDDNIIKKIKTLLIYT